MSLAERLEQRAEDIRALAQEHGDHDAYKIAELVLRIVADPDPSPRDGPFPEEDGAEPPARHEDRIPAKLR